MHFERAKCSNVTPGRCMRRCRQLHMLLPNWLPGFWLKVISQPWEGDITMVLPSMVWQIKKAISNPSKQELYQSLKQVLFYTQSRTLQCHST
jgi:hypothetical protein